MADRIMASRPLAAVSRRLTSERLRILAYHQVDRPENFAYQMEVLLRWFRPVSAWEVLAARRGERELPRRSVWVTFDDGDPSVVENAAPILAGLGIPSTMFVCPSVVDSRRPFWWETVGRALDQGEVAALEGKAFGKGRLDELVGHLKRLPDADRRRLVDDLEQRLAALAGRAYERRQVSSSQLRGYLASGGSLGNHTWDHPCLDRCPPEVQRSQIIEAHRWLEDFLSSPPVLFAYPNGAASREAQAVLVELGYQAALRFDHRLASTRQPALRLSRLRVNDSTSPARFAAILSGVHPMLHGLRARFRGRER
ncbi:MAG: polysaccharide deacetylase family protein [Acidimicrobiia bacterium]